MNTNLHPDSHPQPQPGDNDGFAGRRVMVVDDETGMQAMAKAILEALGHQVILAGSGEEAVEKYRESLMAGQPIELVVMDLALPGGISGIEARQQLAAMDPGVRVIASSGYLGENARVAARQQGFIGVLPKPYTAERLDGEVRRALPA